MPYRWLAVLSLINTLSGCATDNTYAQQQTWLEQNYPDRLRSVKQLSYPSDQFQQQIIAGEIVSGMYIDQVLIATDSLPYGPRPVTKIFWCGEQAVAECDRSCGICNGIILTQKLAILLSGQGPFMQIIEYRPRGTKEIATLYQSISFSPAKDAFRVLGTQQETQH